MPDSVAVLTPVLNGADCLPRYRETLERQTRRPDEILVLDDGSGDGTAEWLRAWSGEDRRVRVITHARNQGRGAARNRLAAEARSDFVTWLDVDDRWHPRKLESQTAAFRAMGLDASTLLCAPYLRINDRTADVKRIDLPRPYGASEYQRIGADALPPVMLQAVFGRRESFLIDGGFDPDLNWSEDFDFFLRFARNGGRIAPQSSDTPLVFYFYTLIGRDPARIEAAHKRLAEKHDGFWPDRAWRDREFRLRSLRYVFYAYAANGEFEDALRLMRDGRRLLPDDEAVRELLGRCEAFLSDRLLARPDLYVPYRHEKANRVKSFHCHRIEGGYRFELTDAGGARTFAFSTPFDAWTAPGPCAEITDAAVETLFFDGVQSLEVVAQAGARQVKRAFPLGPLDGRVVLLPNA